MQYKAKVNKETKWASSKMHQAAAQPMKWQTLKICLSMKQQRQHAGQMADVRENQRLMLREAFCATQSQHARAIIKAM